MRRRFNYISACACTAGELVWPPLVHINEPEDVSARSKASPKKRFYVHEQLKNQRDHDVSEKEHQKIKHSKETEHVLTVSDSTCVVLKQTSKLLTVMIISSVTSILRDTRIFLSNNHRQRRRHHSSSSCSAPFSYILLLFVFQSSLPCFCLPVFFICLAPWRHRFRLTINCWCLSTHWRKFCHTMVCCQFSFL